MRIACSYSRKDSDGEYHERPNFFDVSVYGVHADNVSRYMHKGSRVAIDGRLEWREWETAEHQTRQAVSIVADTVQFLDSPGGPSEAGEGGEDGDDELAGVGAGSTAGDLVF
jgi:single-strand DNA-binding protein